MTIKKLKQKKENGIATLMALGMLSLLLVLGMAFAMSARTDLQVSTAYKTINMATRHAKDSTNKAIHDIRNIALGPYLETRVSAGQRSTPLLMGNPQSHPRWNEWFMSNELSQIYVAGFSQNNLTKNLKDLDQAGLDKAVNHKSGFMHRLIDNTDKNDPSYDPNEPVDFGHVLSWRHIRDLDDNFSFNKSESDVYIGSKSLTLGGAIKGRAFYTVTLDSLKLDPNVMLRQQYLANHSSTGGHLISFDRLIQVYYDHIQDAFSEDLTQNKLTKIYKTEHFARAQDSQIPWAQSWHSLEEMWNAGKFGDTEEDAHLLSGLFETYAQFGDIEAFQEVTQENVTAEDFLTGKKKYILDNDKQASYGDFTRKPALHRFCLTDLADSSMTVEKLLDLDGVKPFWKNSIPDSEVYDDANNPGHMTTCIPWLTRLTPEWDGLVVEVNDPDVPSGTENLRKQVAANLIDYCDTGSEATHDGFGNFPGTTHCGLEKVPYIFKVVFSAVVTKSGSDTTLTGLKAEVGLIDLYDNDSTVTVTGYLNGTQPVSSETSVNADSIAKTEILFEGTSINLSTDGTLPDIAFVVRVGGTVADIFAAPSGKLIISGIDTASLEDDTPVTHKSSICFLDPRANTHAALGEVAPWKISPPATDVEYLADKFNSGSDPSAPTVQEGYRFDLEEADDCRNVSTAYIRNGPMKSMWELGAIHRGEPFRTLRLTKYDERHLGTYLGGDAHLYNQIKLNAATRTKAKPYFNQMLGDYEDKDVSRYFAFDALLRSVIKSDDDSYDLPTSPASSAATDSEYVISDDIWDDMKNISLMDLKDLRMQSKADGKSQDESAFHGRTRGHLAEAIPIAESIKTDKQHEEIFGKVAHMLTSRYCSYTIISTGESVKKMEMSSTMEQKYLTWKETKPEKVPSNWVYIEEEGWYKILGRVKLKSRVRRNLVTEQVEIMSQEVVNE